MNKVVFVFFIGLIFLSCSKQKEVKEKTTPYIISEIENAKHNLRENKSTSGEKPPELLPIIPSIYGSNHFIIDKNDHVYYFQREQEFGFLCGTGMENDTIPPFDGFTPNQLTRVPSGDISKFVKQNLISGIRNFTTIASQKDTLNSKIFFELIKAIKLSIVREDKDFYFIRRTWQEEDTVLHYKKTNKAYNPGSIKWDKTKIKFIEKIDEISPSSK